MIPVFGKAERDRFKAWMAEDFWPNFSLGAVGYPAPVDGPMGNPGSRGGKASHPKPGPGAFRPPHRKTPPYPGQAAHGIPSQG